MYAPEGHNGVSAGAVSKFSGCAVQWQNEEERKRGKIQLAEHICELY